MVPRFRTRNYLRPVNRIKHVFDKQGALGVATQVNELLITTSDTPTLAGTNVVETGSTVNAIYLKVEANATSSAALSNFYMIIQKNPGGNIANVVPNAVGADDNKRFIIHQEMIMFQQVTNSNPRTVFNGVIVLPKAYRRFAPNDLLTINLLTPGVSANYCIQCHYKEFR